MSINVQTISDKAEFTNYFTDPMTIPRNAEIVNTKASLALPIMVSPYVVVPDISAPYDDVACTIVIDGVQVEITWLDIFNAHVTFTASGLSIDNIEAGGEGDYFGKYRFYPSDNVKWLANNEVAPHALAQKIKISFNQVLGQAINTKFFFYSVNPNPEYTTSDYITMNSVQSIVTGLTNATTGAPITALSLGLQTQRLTKFGFNTIYDPAKVSAQTEDFVNIAAADAVNWTIVGNGHLLSTAGGTNVAFLGTTSATADPATIDPNGGWIGCRADHSSGKMAWGLILQGEGKLSTFDPNFLAGGGTNIDTSMIDVGFEIEQNAGGNKVVTILDGKHRHVIYDGGAVTEEIRSIRKPTKPIMGFTNNSDRLFIQIKRGTIVNGNHEFIFSFFHSAGSPLNDTDDQLIYVSKQTFSGGRLFPTPCFLSDNVVGNKFDLIATVDSTVQSQQQGDYFTDSSIDMGGQNAMGNMSILPNVSGDVGGVVSADISGEIYKFWKSWGFDNPKNTGNENLLTDEQYFASATTSALSNSFQINTNFVDAPTNYWIGENSLGRIYALDPTGNYLEPIAGNPLTALPQQLDISINNMDIKNYVGAFVSGTIINQSNSLSRIVGTIPIDTTNIGNTQIVNLQYEPYNLVYRPINNPNPFNLNELKIEIFYRDFTNNVRRIVSNVFGTINLEFNIRMGYLPKKPMNNLLPY